MAGSARLPHGQVSITPPYVFNLSQLFLASRVKSMLVCSLQHLPASNPQTGCIGSGFYLLSWWLHWSEPNLPHSRQVTLRQWHIVDYKLTILWKNGCKGWLTDCLTGWQPLVFICNWCERPFRFWRLYITAAVIMGEQNRHLRICAILTIFDPSINMPKHWASVASYKSWFHAPLTPGWYWKQSAFKVAKAELDLFSVIFFFFI